MLAFSAVKAVETAVVKADVLGVVPSQVRLRGGVIRLVERPERRLHRLEQRPDGRRADRVWRPSSLATRFAAWFAAALIAFRDATSKAKTDLLVVSAGGVEPRQ